LFTKREDAVSPFVPTSTFAFVFKAKTEKRNTSETPVLDRWSCDYSSAHRSLNSVLRQYHFLAGNSTQTTNEIEKLSKNSSWPNSIDDLFARSSSRRRNEKCVYCCSCYTRALPFFDFPTDVKIQQRKNRISTDEKTDKDKQTISFAGERNPRCLTEMKSEIVSNDTCTFAHDRLLRIYSSYRFLLILRKRIFCENQTNLSVDSTIVIVLMKRMGPDRIWQRKGKKRHVFGFNIRILRMIHIEWDSHETTSRAYWRTFLLWPNFSSIDLPLCWSEHNIVLSIYLYSTSIFSLHLTKSEVKELHRSWLTESAQVIFFSALPNSHGQVERMFPTLATTIFY
jgi:ferredoxin